MNRFLLFSLLAFAFAACQTPETDTTEVVTETPTRTVSDPSADRAAIEAVSAAWEAGARAGDPDALVALNAPDAVILPGDEPMVRGREALSTYFAANYSDPIDLTLEAVEIVIAPSGDFAYEVGTSIAPDGRGKYLTVYHRTADGWEIAADSWSNDAPAPGTTDTSDG